MTDIRVGYIKNSAKLGDRVTVYFDDGTKGRFTAENDLTSSKVAVICDRAFSGDVARQELVVNTKLFRSKTNYQDDDKDYPWAYLFEVNDFAAFTGASGSVINYTDTCWELDDAEGFIRALGDGGGRYKTQPTSASLFHRHDHYIEIIKLGGYPVYNDSSGLSYGTADYPYEAYKGDGVIYHGVNNYVESEDQTYVKEYQLPEVYALPDSIYQMTDDTAVSDINYAIKWEAGGTGMQSGGYRDFLEVVSEGNSGGETARYAIAERIYYTPEASNNSSDKYANSIGSRFVRVGSGSGSGGFGSPPADPTGVAFLNNRALSAFAALADSGYIAPSWITAASPFGGSATFTGQQIIDGQAHISYPDPIYHIPDRVGFSVPALNLFMYADYNTYPTVVYSSSTKMVPRAGRSPGVKKIYAQVRDNKKVLLHEIPSFEPWDGYISKLPNDEIQVVLKCAKKFHSTDGITNSYPNEYSNVFASSVLFGFYAREWSQIRVYNLSNKGDILSLQIFNNSKTDLNPSDTPDTIEIDHDNWQIEWLADYKDLRATQLRSDNIFTQSGSVFQSTYTFTPSSLINNLINSQMTLKSALRYKLGEARCPYSKGIPNTGVIRPIIETIACGSLTPKGFVYVNPNDLLDSNVTISNSWRVLLPSLNYSIVSGLVNNSQTQRRYYICPDSEYINNNFIIGSSTQKPTLFPKLDLTASDLGGTGIPDSQTYGQYYNMPVEDVIEETAPLRRFGLRAIAFLS